MTKTLIATPDPFDEAEWEDKYWAAAMSEELLDNLLQLCKDADHERTDHTTPPPHGTNGC